MAKPSAFLQRVEAKHQQNMRLQRLFTIQIIPEDTPKPDDYCSYGERKDYD